MQVRPILPKRHPPRLAHYGNRWGKSQDKCPPPCVSLFVRRHRTARRNDARQRPPPTPATSNSTCGSTGRTSRPSPPVNRQASQGQAQGRGTAQARPHRAAAGRSPALLPLPAPPTRARPAEEAPRDTLSQGEPRARREGLRRCACRRTDRCACWAVLAPRRALSSRTPTSRCRSATAGRRVRAREAPPGAGRAATGTRAALRSRPLLPARQHVLP